MKKSLVLVGSVLALSFYFDGHFSVASQINKQSDDMEITSPKYKSLEGNKIEEEINQFSVNQGIEENKIEEDVEDEALRKQRARIAASERVDKLLGLNKKDKGKHKKH